MDAKRARPSGDAGGAPSKRAAGSGGSSGRLAASQGEPIAEDLIEDAIDMGADDAMEDADFEDAAGPAPDGEEVQLGEAGRNWERPEPPPLNPRTDALGAQLSELRRAAYAAWAGALQCPTFDGGGAGWPGSGEHWASESCAVGSLAGALMR